MPRWEVRTLINSLLDLRRGQVIRTAGLGYDGLALDDVKHQGRLALGRPALDVAFHHRAHRCVLSKLTPEQEFTGSIQLCRPSLGLSATN